MPYKKKTNPGTIQFNKLIDELPEKRKKIKAQIEFRNNIIESQKRINYKTLTINEKVIRREIWQINNFKTIQ